MDRDKKIQLENTHKDFIQAILMKLPISKLDEIAIEDVMGYGTTIEEKTFDLDGMKAIVELQKQQSENIQIDFSTIPVHRRLNPDNNTAIYVDELTVILNMEEGPNEINLRLSCIYEFLGNSWKLTHWHGSTGVDTEKDPFHLEEWKKQKEELQKQVEEQTADLSRKNRELEIEAALERVRTRAMSMQKPNDLLDVCQIISEQLEDLGISNIRNIQVAIIDLPNKNYLNYQYFTAYSKKVFEITKYRNNPASLAMVTEMQKSANSFFIGSIKNDELKKFKAWRKKYKQFPDPLLDDLNEVFYYFYSIGEGGLGLTTYKKTSKDSLEIFKRFHKVFTMAYQKFKDIELAERQAREAQIESSLERIRSRTMGMHNSGELKEVIQLVYEQMLHLDIHIEHAGFIMNYKERDDMHIWLADKNGVPSEIYIPYFDSPHWNSFIKAKEKGKDFFVNKLDFEEKNKFYRDLFAYIPGISDKTKEFYFSCPGLAISTVLLDNIGLYIENFSGTAYSKEENKILMRFGKVFQQTYTRFLDLKKAEEQAREAQIETGLERVRSASMAMHKTDELKQVIETVFNQLSELKLPLDACYIDVFEEENWDLHLWVGTGTDTYPEQLTIPYLDHPLFNRTKKARLQGESFFTIKDGKKSKDEFVRHFISIYPVANDRVKYMLESNGVDMSVAISKNASLSIYNYRGISYKAEENEIIQRFSRVFQQAYTRFIDLKNAEAQAREAQIEAALERVRASTMAMHSSKELSNVASVLLEQIKILGGDLFAFGIVLCDKHDKMVEQWHSMGEGEMLTPFLVPVDLDYIHRYRYDKWKAGEQLFSVEIPEDYIARHFELMFELPTVKAGMKQMSAKGIEVEIPEWEIDYGASFSHGYLLVSSLKPFPESYIFPRFAKVFEQAYTRFLDLQKAEAQAREAQIEAALERVRSRSIAMRSSKELADLSFELVKQVHALGIDTWFCAFNIWDDHPDGSLEWGSNAQGTYEEYRTPREGIFLKYYEAGQQGEKLLVNEINENECPAHYEYLCSLPGVGEQLLAMKEAGIPFPTYQIDHAAYFKYGYILFITFQAVPEAHDIFKRFAKVFEQTYSRFLDLKNAEDLAREAQIEAALERVRSKTMAMHNSQDVGETVVALFDEVLKLGLDKSIRVGIGILEGNEGMETWSATSNAEGEVDLKTGMLDMTIHPMLVGLKKAWESGKTSYSYDYIGEDVFRYYKALNNEPEYPFHADLESLPEKEYHRSFFYAEGILFSFAPNPISDEAAMVLDRFARVFGQTYRRYLDLQIAEEQAREAVKQASLDRIRGQIASMRNATDLQQITPLIWNELKSLEVPFFRCGVFIVDDKQKHVQVYLTTPEGKSLAALDLDFEMSDLTRNTVASWRKNEVFQAHWNKKEFIAWTQEMMRLHQIEKAENYQGAEEPPESLHLHFIPFAQGMLYVGNTEQLNDEKINLVKSLAEAFSFAYARYEDFVVLEEAKERIEKTLSDLKATQSQLVHAEKMASLGELTAGIAHEIQNPLNFVNNFSEVNSELLAELLDEVGNGDLEEVVALAKDIAQNEQKISFHGKRADGIVKGMLQHSRSGNGQKVPTDINALADEYLRLSFHGLRAKDKSFNADFSVNFDEAIPKADVVPQDIGRVLLNLINNGFFAAAERGKKEGVNFKPLVSVSTLCVDNKVIIKVKDNGGGIPPDIKDKIFQPFFTTKPTGEGTGLGLSLSFDIITKGHDGKLHVQSEKGIGTEFIIELPINK